MSPSETVFRHETENHLGFPMPGSCSICQLTVAMLDLVELPHLWMIVFMDLAQEDVSTKHAKA